MASLIPGYEYDIFISYRQKDNKGDRWVSEFVEALKTELESTFKEEISVYFDINPSDYLLESYDVDASLKDKLKCLVFIPILSRTYCDSKSFAWVHEFKAFVEQASKDEFGLKVKLPNGNVASRVLPVIIHDLDPSDIKECESVLGGVLRGIEFIYKEAGIDKPLAPNDDEKNNINKTKYRIQIIKVAHSIKEIILGMKSEPAKVTTEGDKPKESIKEVREEEKKEIQEEPAKITKRKLLYGIGILAVLIATAILAYPKLFKRNTLESLRASGERISVAVMPFQNMTGDESRNFWQEMIQDNLIISLSNSEELIVRQAESIITLLQHNNVSNYISITPSIARKVSQKLDANIFISGSINQLGTTIRLNVKLTDTRKREIIKTFQKEGNTEDIFSLIDTLSSMVRDYLILSKLKDVEQADLMPFVSTNSPEAYKFFIYGENERRKWNNEMAAKYYSQAVALDSNFAYAVVMLSYSYINLEIYDQPKSLCMIVFNKREMMNTRDRIWINILYAYLFETPTERITYLTQLQKIDNQNPIINFQLGYAYACLSQNVDAIREYENALKIYDDWGTKPYWHINYSNLGQLYHLTGEYKKEKKLYRRAEKDFPDNLILLSQQSVLALSEGKIKAADEYIERYKSISKENSVTEAEIAGNLANIYRRADLFDIAEEFYRQALSLEPESLSRRNNLAWFLIDTERNINEGIVIIDSVLKYSPDNYIFLYTKGCGLYNRGKYQEALDVLQESWNLRRKYAEYNHNAFLHLEAAKKAVEGQK